jgi:hypothetical protein
VRRGLKWLYVGRQTGLVTFLYDMESAVQDGGRATIVFLQVHDTSAFKVVYHHLEVCYIGISESIDALIGV